MDQRIATALTFGIRMDTQKLSRGVCKMDMEMIWRMFDLCDQDMIYLLENSTLYFEDLMAYSKAISSIEVFENISFADTGRDCPGGSDRQCVRFYACIGGKAFFCTQAKFYAVLLYIHGKRAAGSFQQQCYCRFTASVCTSS